MNGTTTGTRITIGDVAERAGVSIATVSRVVNERYGVAAETIVRVQRGDRRARLRVEPHRPQPAQPAHQRHRHPRHRHRAVQRRAAEGRRQGAARRSTSSWSSTPAACPATRAGSAATSRGSAARSPTAPSSSRPPSSRCTPIIRWSPSTRTSAARRCPPSTPRTSRVRVEATRHLLRLGHRRIGFLAGRRDLESARRREAGYRAALDEAGIAFDPELVAVGGFTEETAAAPARALLAARPDRPTAIFAANDLSAIQVHAHRRRARLRVPDDLSVVGFDNIPESALTDPPLTTVDQSIQALGDEAVRLLARPDRAPRAATATSPVARHLAHRAASSCVAPLRRRAPCVAACHRIAPLKSFQHQLHHNQQPNRGGI